MTAATLKRAKRLTGAVGLLMLSAVACNKPRSPSWELANPATYKPLDRSFLDTCQACHGAEGLMAGSPPRPTPRLLGQEPAYIVAALRAYRSGARNNPTMRAEASNLTDDQIDLAAVVMSGEQTLLRRPVGPVGPVGPGGAGGPGGPRGPAGPGGPRDPLMGPPAPPVVESICAGCHGRSGRSVVPEYPKLGGQREDYLHAALADYQSGARVNPIMQTIVRELSPQDIDDVARYFAARDGLVAAKPEPGQ